jgi:TrmH family RNA methyltransferase
MPPAEVIRSRSNPLYKRLAALKDQLDRELCLLEGPLLVEEALAAGVAIREVVASPRAAERWGALVSMLGASGVAVRLLDDALVASLSEAETSQGLFGIADRPAAGDDAWLAAAQPLVLVAVAIQNPGNLGALLRTAEAAGVTGACLTRGCADPLSWKALRGSMGSAFRLPLATGVELERVLSQLRERAIPTVAATAEAAQSYDAFDWRGPAALLLGNEAAGLPAEAARAASARVAIPMAGGVESLNVSAAAAVLLFEAARQRRSAS